jgi:hypothetical protein
MARAKNESPLKEGDITNPAPSVTDDWTESGLSEMTQEQLEEIADGLEILHNEATKEELIASILEAQNGDEDSAGTDGNQDSNGDETPPQSDKEEDKTPTIPDAEKKGTPSNDGEISIFSKTRKGKTIVGVTGKPITFDSEGKAKVNKADAEYLTNCPGFEIK